MYRVLLIVCGALSLAACSSMPSWWNQKIFKSEPVLDSVRFESEPPGAEAKVSNGQTCRTPCALALSPDAPLTVTFSLNGYQPENESLEPVSDGGQPRLRPNPVVVELTPAPPPPSKPEMKKPPVAKKKPVASKPAAKPKTAAAPAAAPAAQAAPWPAPQPKQ
jgi:hypothetical protein